MSFPSSSLGSGGRATTTSSGCLVDFVINIWESIDALILLPHFIVECVIKHLPKFSLCHIRVRIHHLEAEFYPRLSIERRHKSYMQEDSLHSVLKIIKNVSFEFSRQHSFEYFLNTFGYVWILSDIFGYFWILLDTHGFLKKYNFFELNRNTKYCKMRPFLSNSKAL